VQGVIEKKLIRTTSSDFLGVLNHPEAGVSTNVFLRILHNRALDLGWIVQPVIAKRAGLRFATTIDGTSPVAPVQRGSKRRRPPARKV
jgi:hypothetical protein